MKTISTKLFFIIVFSIFSLTSLYAQVPQAINFQAIARDANGNPMANTNIQLRLSVIDSAASGAISYQELRALQTNAHGSFSFQIGVNPDFTTEGNFQSIDWMTGNKCLKIDYDPTNTFTFNLSLGTIKFATVPYAFVAESVVFIDATGAQDGDVLVYNSVTGKFEPSALTETNYTAGIGISIVGNTINNTGDLSDTNEIQNISISNDTIFLSNGGFVKLPSVVNRLQAPAVIAQDASPIQPFEATLNGTINAHNLMTTVVFEWGATAAYGNTATATQSPVTGTSDMPVSVTLAGLQSATTYHFRIKAQNAVNVVYSDDMSFTTKNSIPQLTTTSVSSILAFSASSGGNITYDGGSPVTERGLCWSTSPNPTIANTHVASGSGSGPFTTNLTSLTHNTKYYVRAYAKNSVGIAYGNEVTFTTQSGVATLSTAYISSITGISAVCGGNVSADGGTPITAKGVCWSTTTGPTTLNSSTNDGSGTGAFTSNISGLSLGTTYYVRAYATNAVGTTYGTERSFTTVALPIVTTSNASDIKGNSAKAGGVVTNNGGSAVTAQGLCWSTSHNPTTANSKTTSFTDLISSLSPNTTYYVRAYATNNAGTGYGNEISFNSGYIIGASHTGGLVFYNDGSGHGLVCAESNQSAGAEWGCYGTAIGGTSTEINTGAANTNAIVAGCTTAGIAAKICYDLELNSYSDWYLPSKDELYLMYVNLHTQGKGGFAAAYYWSSSEYSGSATGVAWVVRFSDGNVNYGFNKNYSHYVRAVRAF